LKKVIAAIVMALLITYGNANAQETMKFDTESKKFIFIRQMLSK